MTGWKETSFNTFYVVHVYAYTHPHVISQTQARKRTISAPKIRVVRSPTFLASTCVRLARPAGQYINRIPQTYMLAALGTCTHTGKCEEKKKKKEDRVRRITISK